MRDLCLDRDDQLMPEAAGRLHAQQTAPQRVQTNGGTAAAPRRRGRPPNSSRQRGGSRSRSNTPARNRRTQANDAESTLPNEEEREAGELMNCFL